MAVPLVLFTSFIFFKFMQVFGHKPKFGTDLICPDIGTGSQVKGSKNFMTVHAPIAKRLKTTHQTCGGTREKSPRPVGYNAWKPWIFVVPIFHDPSSRVISLDPLGTKNMCIKVCDNPSNSCSQWIIKAMWTIHIETVISIHLIFNSGLKWWTIDWQTNIAIYRIAAKTKKGARGCNKIPDCVCLQWGVFGIDNWKLHLFFLTGNEKNAAQGWQHTLYLMLLTASWLLTL